MINKASRSEGTSIALITQLQSEVEQEEKSESDEEKEGFSKQPEQQVSFGELGFFSWVETVIYFVIFQELIFFRPPLTEFLSQLSVEVYTVMKYQTRNMMEEENVAMD